MKLLVPLLVLTTFTSSISAYWKGFNIKSNLADGVTCKSAKDWASAFAQLKAFPNKINSARLYSSHTCNTLLSAVPQAISSHTFILVGLLATPTNFEAEKGALLQAVKQYGFNWIAAISVGSEDLYRGTTNASHLASQIYDVRGMLQELPGWNGSIKVGHVDTTNAWTNTSNYDVIRACDFIGTDIYPYFQTLQDNNVSNSYDLFWNGVKQVQNAVSKAGSTASVWVTETGWPVNGPVKNQATPGTGEARMYWSAVACSAFDRINTFWFTLQDWSAVPSFAVVGQDGSQLYDQSC
ncbi:glycoside hydrolase family 17 protein [Acephala macrosclerotiorum]|nr:glycoside hydrolase family 17 protein [Acephala macrosclerotiorum]